MSSSLLVDSPPKLCTLRARVDTGYRAAAAGAPVIAVHPVPPVSLCVTQVGWSKSIAWVIHAFRPAAGSWDLGAANHFVGVDNVSLLLLSALYSGSRLPPRRSPAAPRRGGKGDGDDGRAIILPFRPACPGSPRAARR